LKRIVLSALAAVALAAPALAQVPVPPPPSAGGGAPSRLTPPESGRNAPSYETDGNAKNPAELQNPNVPSYQRGSGQETGGPARELIPSR
jgi:hypothetical protein